MGEAMADDFSGFEEKVRGVGDTVVKSLGLGSTTGKPGFLELLVRGAFLDGAAYRAAADDTGGTPLAIVAFCLPVLAASFTTILYPAGLFYTGLLGSMLLITLVIGLISVFVAVAIMAALSKSILGTAVDFGRMLRGIAYAQSPGIFAFVPVIGFILGLWRLVTTWVAIREISGADGTKAVVLMLLACLIMFVISAVLSGVLLTSALFGVASYYR